MADQEVVYIWWPLGFLIPFFLIVSIVACVFMDVPNTVYKSVTRNPDGSVTTTYRRAKAREKNTPIVLQARANRII